MKDTVESGCAVVMSQETAERLLTTDSTNIHLHVDGIWQAPHRMFCHGSISESLMRAILVVESNKLLIDMIEVPQAEAHEVVQAFSLDGADPRLHKCIGVQYSEWRPQSTVPRILDRVIEHL